MSQLKDADYDPALTQLFASSVRPAESPPTTALHAESLANHDEGPGHIIPNSETNAQSIELNDNIGQNEKPRKRKRKMHDDDDAVETRYMRHLALQEAREDERSTAIASHQKSQKVNEEKTRGIGDIKPGKSSGVADVEDDQDHRDPSEEPPRHETIALDGEATNENKAVNTIFLANISTSAITSKAAKKELMSHLTSFIPSLPQSHVRHAIESLRFRSTAFAESGMPRKAAFIKQELMDSTTKSTNAYAVYTTQLAAREAVNRLNGTTILNRHLRVDSVTHPAKQDPRRSVFVGNLSFVDDTTNIDAAKDIESQSKPRKGKEPGDVEEGLWRQFGKAGRVESVRVVRDKTTRVGKGFAYVQFLDTNAVEKALSFNGKKFPPMLPRILRVTRAKSITKTKSSNGRSGTGRSERTSTKSDPRGMSKKGPANSFKASQSFGVQAKRALGRTGAAPTVGRLSGTGKTRKPTKNSDRRAKTFKKKTR